MSGKGLPPRGTLAVVIILVLGVTAAAFGYFYWFPGHPVSKTPRMTLLSRIGAATLEPGPDAEGEVLHDLSLGDGLGDWKVVQGDPGFDIEEGVLIVRNGKGVDPETRDKLPTVLEAPLGAIDADRVTHVRIELRLAPGDFRPVLSWASNPGDGAERVPGQWRISCPQGELAAVLLPVSENRAWGGTVSALRITGIPVPGESWGIRSMQLLHFDQRPHRARWKISATTRDAIVGRVPFSVEALDLEMHRTATGLRFELAGRGNPAGFRFRLEQPRANGESVVLLEETVQGADLETPRPIRLDLAELIRDRRFDLRFVFEPISESGGSLQGVLIAPALEYSVRDWKRPNLILISLDTLRADHLGCYGYSRKTSPFLDRLASQGVLFENCFAQAPETLASTMSLFTGRYASNHGVFRAAHRLCDEEATLAHLLRDAGYRTAAFVEGGFVESPYGFDLGFDLYHDGDKIPGDRGGDVETTFRRGREWLERNDHRPFYLFLHTYEIHTPYVPPPEYRDRFVDPDYSGFFKGKIFNDDLARSLLDRTRAVEITEEDRRHVVGLYDAGIAYVDRVLEEFFRFLGERGRLQDTLVVITSDHGEDLGDHNALGIHGHTLHRAVTHVPLIVYGWALAGDLQVLPRRLDARVGGVDVAPTLLEIAGVDPERYAGMQGRSLRRFLTEERTVSEEDRGRDLFSEDLTNFKRTAVFSGKYKYVKTFGYERHRGDLVRALQPGLTWFFTRYREHQLYDLDGDQDETVNLHGRVPSRDRELEELVREFGERMKRDRPERCAATLDDAARRRLIELGYAEQVAGDPASPGGVNPGEDPFDLVTHEEDPAAKTDPSTPPRR